MKTAPYKTPCRARRILKRCIESNLTFFWYQYAAADALENPAGVLGKSSLQGVDSAPAGFRRLFKE